MRRAAATAHMLTAAILLAPGCGERSEPPPSKDEPLRRAGFRSLAARDFLLSCPDAGRRREVAYQAARHEELKQLAARNGAARTVALGENEWAGLSRHTRRETCLAGDEAYRQAVAAYSGALDTLAARLAEPRP
jgi:hypothetical protein